MKKEKTEEMEDHKRRLEPTGNMVKAIVRPHLPWEDGALHDHSANSEDAL